MPDQSALDKKYFVDKDTYNCPFCNRRNVKYIVRDHTSFDWSEKKTCYVYTVRCTSCKNDSLHLSFRAIPIVQIGDFYHNEFKLEGAELDDLFFYSVPTSFFVLDDRIPSVLRELYSEAEGCQKSNFLTGASACARKLVYELAKREGAAGDNYDDRIKSLKVLKTEIDPTFFDTLLTIQKVTSDKVHENAYDGWTSNHIRVILASLYEILVELYVLPSVRKERRAEILRLGEEVLGKKRTEADEQSG